MVERFAQLTGGTNRGRALRVCLVVATLMGSGVAIGCVIAPQIARQKTQECSLEESMRAVRELLHNKANDPSAFGAHMVNMNRRVREALILLRDISKSSHPSSHDAYSLLSSLQSEIR